MAFLQTNHCKIKAIAATVPSTIVYTKDYDYISVPEREMFAKTTGIQSRRMATNGLCTSELCEKSANRIINDLHVDRNQIDVLIFVSQSPEYLLPANSIILQNRLHLGNHTMAFDISLGCSGYVYGLSVINSLMETGKFKYGLLLVGDISTHAQNYKDKTAYPLFGDAGTATLIEYCNEDQPMHFLLNSDGSGYNAIIQPDGGIKSPITPNSFIEKEYEPGVIRTTKNLFMNGMDVFNFSIQVAPQSIKSILEKVNLTIDNIDYFVLHQANKLMNETIRKKLKIDAIKLPYSIDEFGNTSSASIPLTIIHKLRNELENSNKKLCMTGFGVGLSWATCISDFNNVYCPEIMEI